MKTLLLSPQLPAQAKQKLSRMGFHLCFTRPCRFFSSPVAFHPDLQFFRHPDSSLFTLGVTPLPTEAESPIPIRFSPSEHFYDNEAKLNILRVGKVLFANKKKCYEFSFPPDFQFIHVNQGYAGCSSVPVGEKALITDDEGIADAASQCGLEVLLLSKGDVGLSGYPYGFIGGSCVEAEGHRLFFFGNPLLKKEGEEMLSFLRRHGYSVISLWDGPLCDFGSGVFVQ